MRAPASFLIWLSGCFFASCITPNLGDGTGIPLPDYSISGQVDYQGSGQLYLWFFFKNGDGTFYHVLIDRSYNNLSERSISTPLNPGEYIVTATTSRQIPDVKTLNTLSETNRLVAKLIIPSGRMFGHRRLIYIGTFHFTYINSQLTVTVTDNFEKEKEELSHSPFSGFALPDLEKEILTWK